MKKEIKKHIIQKLNLFHSKWNWNYLSMPPNITWDIDKDSPAKP